MSYQKSLLLSSMLLLLFIFGLLVIFKGTLSLFETPLDLRQMIKPTSDFMHQLCVRQTSGFKEHSEAAAALVCGHQIESIELQSLFASSGLIHLLVVSGSHLLVISKAFDRLQIKKSIKIILLFAFVLICEINAPITRSFIALLVADFVHSKKWTWSPSFKQWVTSLICLTINPLWITSLSFQMSWMASLCLEIADCHHVDKKIHQFLLQTFLIYFAFFFIFGFLGFPSLWSPFFGLALTPVLELVLFPLAFIGCLVPQSSVLFESVFSLMISTVEFFNPEKNFLLYFDRSFVITMNNFMIVLLLTFLLKVKKVKI